MYNPVQVDLCVVLYQTYDKQKILILSSQPTFCDQTQIRNARIESPQIYSSVTLHCDKRQRMTEAMSCVSELA